MKKKNRIWLWIILGVAVVAVAGNLFIRWWNRDVISIKTAVVGRGVIEEIVSASGQVDAPVYNLGPKLGGKIVKLNVREGDRVREDMTLAEFDDTTRIVAPANGVVARINYEEGETVVPGSPAIVVVNYEKSWAEAQIDEVDIAGVRLGDKVKITSDVYPDKIYMGEIDWIAPVAELRKVGGRIKMDEESYVFPCKVKFLGAHAELRVNMSVNVDIVTRRKENALLVPRETLASVDDSSVVFIVKNNRVFQGKIDIGLRSYASVEAVAGVAEGEIIAASNISKLKNKGRVKIER
ncbi:efflux RND transporter periplasmic adaptor subunit [Candidatus Saganbacteria bacterium]|uniref:Efflux RND transporter periplasmic adaptor subunit n=1 Tax=Candidatus Saganbacteria bacterium TaxID=2575572 RepID=A0A9D6YSX2_UNCSA|nr:efflux RND transporter periplasmic adaptor subunit [Candidatus Saganbacteria bacterium]